MSLLSVSPKHIVLVGSAGTGTAFGAICALRRVWGTEIHVVAMDVNPAHLCTSSLLADSYEQIVPFADPDFPAALRSILIRHSVDTYLPLYPNEIELAAQFVLREPAILPYANLIPKLDTALLCNDKARLSEFLTMFGMPIPRCWSGDPDLDASAFFVKPRSGTGSHGAKQITREALIEMPDSVRCKLLVQELCFGPEITVDVFVGTSEVGTRSLCRERLETKAGVATKCRVFHDAEIEAMASKLADCMQISGSFCFQLMRNSSGNFVVTDVNPRPGAATAMSVATGNDFFAATFANAWGEDCSRYFHVLNKDRYVTRQFTEFVMTDSNCE